MCLYVFRGAVCVRVHVYECVYGGSGVCVWVCMRVCMGEWCVWVCVGVCVCACVCMHAQGVVGEEVLDQTLMLEKGEDERREGRAGGGDP